MRLQPAVIVRELVLDVRRHTTTPLAAAPLAFPP
jgi:hypothetical protein